MPGKRKAKGESKGKGKGEVDIDQIREEMNLKVFAAKSELSRAKNRISQLEEQISKSEVNIATESETTHETIKHLQHQLSKLNREHEQRTMALKTKEQDLTRNIEDLNKQIENINSDKDALKNELKESHEQFEKHLNELRHAHEIIPKLKDDIKNLESILTKERKEHQDEIDGLERRWYQEKDKILLDAKNKVRAAKEEKFTDEQLNDVMRRTLLENQQLSQELSLVTREIEELYQTNEKNVKLIEKLQTDLELEQERSSEAARQTSILEAVLRKIHSGMVVQQEMQAKSLAEKDHRIVELSAEIDVMKSEKPIPITSHNELSELENIVLSHLNSCSVRELERLEDFEQEGVIQSLIQRLLVHLGYHPYDFLSSENLSYERKEQMRSNVHTLPNATSSEERVEFTGVYGSLSKSEKKAMEELMTQKPNDSFGLTNTFQQEVLLKSIVQKILSHLNMDAYNFVKKSVFEQNDRVNTASVSSIGVQTVSDEIQTPFVTPKKTHLSTLAIGLQRPFSNKVLSDSKQWGKKSISLSHRKKNGAAGTPLKVAKPSYHFK
ncbi:hypothetical protein PCE1_001980 [Barthelona sp. PCE]